MSEPVVISGDRVVRLAEVKVRASRLAAAMRDLGVSPGDRYAIVMRNEPGFLEANLVASIIGVVPVPVNWHWTGTDLEHLLHDSGSKVAFVHTDLLPAVEANMPGGMTIIEVAVPPELVAGYNLGEVPLSGRHATVAELIDGHEPVTDAPADPPMAVIYTSGTTGRAKGILRDPIAPQHRERLVAIIREVMGFEPGGTTLIPAPLYHTAPNVAATFAVAAGMNIVIMPRFDAEQFLQLVEKHRVTSVQMVPTMFVRLLQLPDGVRTKYDLSSLTKVVHAAAPCPPDVKRAMIDWVGPIVTEYYGGSESGIWVHCTSQEWLDHPGTVGRASRTSR